MSTQRYLELRLSVPRAQLESITALLWELGTLGTQEEGSGEDLHLTAYFPEGMKPDNLLAVVLHECQTRGVRCSELAVSEVPDDTEAWLAKYRETVTGISVTSRIFVHPPWKPASPSHPVNLLIEPGRAFGTGSHESTQLCLRALEESLDDMGTLLDVGTGSGILAIAASKLRPDMLLAAVDVDEMALESARENLERNGLTGVQLSVGGPEAVRRSFHAVVANLTLNIFREVAPELARHASKRLILSGFTDDQESLVLELFDDKGFQLSRRWTLNDWVCCRLDRVQSGIRI